MRLFADSLTEEEVQWYWCQPGARPLGFPTVFGSNVWQRNDPWAYYDGPGETPTRPVFVNGRDPGAPPGICYLGARDEWVNGLTHPLALAAPLPKCCQRQVSLPARSRFGIGLRGRFRAIARLRLVAPLKAGLAASEAARGQLGATLPLKAGLAASEAARGQLGATLPLKAGLAASEAARGQLGATLPLKAGLAASEAARGQLGATLPLKAGLAASEAARGQLGATLPLKAGLAAATRIPLQMAATLPLKIGMIGTEHATGQLGATLPLKEQVSAALHALAAAADTGSGQITVSMSMSAFQMVTPIGGCGSLPASLVCRFSGATGTCGAANGKSCTLTYNSGTQTWNGSLTLVGAGTTFVALTCVASQWRLTLGGSCMAAFTNLTGTSGASPNLTGTLIVSMCCMGNVTATVTRT
jgi:hypothetical protein